MAEDFAPWDHDYANRGRIWGGAVHDLPAIPDGSRVLELGCGDGKTFSALLHRGFEITGIDFSGHAATMSYQYTKKAGAGAILVADARSLPFREGSFDAVVVYHVIGHMLVPDRAAIVRESSRVLAPGGSVWFSEFSCEDFRAGNGREVEPHTFERKNGITTHYFSEQEIQDLFHDFYQGSLCTCRWTMTVRGKQLPRAEITGMFFLKP